MASKPPTQIKLRTVINGVNVELVIDADSVRALGAVWNELHQFFLCLDAKQQQPPPAEQ